MSPADAQCRRAADDRITNLFECVYDRDNDRFVA